MNEARALRDLQRGSQRALEWFIETYNAYVSTIVFHIFGSRMGQADLEETVSDVFLAFWKHADKVQPDKVRAYLGAIARNAAKTKLRSCGKEPPLEDSLLVIDVETPERIVEQAELRQLVRQAVIFADGSEFATGCIISSPYEDGYVRHETRWNAPTIDIHAVTAVRIGDEVRECP